MQNARNSEEDSIRVKYDGKPIIVKFQNPIHNASKFIDFFLVENFNFVLKPILVDFANQLLDYLDPCTLRLFNLIN